MKTERNLGLDLYKIICMFLVISFHFSDHGKTNLDVNLPFTFNWMLLATARIWGGICNCAFVLISGYFLCGKQFRLRSLVRLWLQVWTYSTVIGIICYFIGTEPYSMISIISMLLPFTFDQYWFFSSYLILYMLFPFLNLIIRKITRTQHLFIILMMSIIFSVIPTCFNVTWQTGSNQIIIFVLLYFIGSYLRIYDIKKVSSWRLIVFSILILTGEVLSIAVLKHIRYDNPTYFIWEMYKTPVIIFSVLLFGIFERLKIKQRKSIEFISSSVFGIYLFHIGRLNILLFQKIFNNEKTYYTNYFFLQMMLACIVIFITGVFVDKLRILLIEKNMMRLIDRILAKTGIQEKADKLLSTD